MMNYDGELVLAHRSRPKRSEASSGYSYNPEASVEGFLDHITSIVFAQSLPSYAFCLTEDDGYRFIASTNKDDGVVITRNFSGLKDHSRIMEFVHSHLDWED